MLNWYIGGFQRNFYLIVIATRTLAVVTNFNFYCRKLITLCRFVAGHPKIEPKSFLLSDVVENFKHEYLFIACIDFINRVKTGPFPEHSNQLWNISGVVSWSKINQGLIKMYKAEVLSKFPVIQHVLFGSLMTFKVRSASGYIRNARLSVTPPDPLKTLMDPPGVLRPARDADTPGESKK